MNEIRIKTIPHKHQRYVTTGDYFIQNDKLIVRVSESNEDSEFLVAIHELIEYYLTKKKGIKIEEIDTFDMEFEKKRKIGLFSSDCEPGDHPHAPYNNEHCVAEGIERIIAGIIKKNWLEHENQLNNL